MNENPSPQRQSTRPPIDPVLPALFVPRPTLGYWVRRFFACNPFYLVSAALLLYGVYRVSIDPTFLAREAAQLFFNYTALQCYELMLVVTAVFLARRAIWYDSTLLVWVENLLVLVPIILVSEAAQVDKRWVWGLCLVAGGLAAGRFSGLKRSMPVLNWPDRLVGIGGVVLAVNVALPIVYRILHQYKVGTRPDWGAAYETNQYCWWLLLPALCALLRFVPASGRRGAQLPQIAWMPMGLAGLWLAGSAAHLYCLGYVYDFSLRPELVAPALWMLLWVVASRLPEFVPGLKDGARRLSWMPPMLVALLAAGQAEKTVFLVLTVLNAVVYGSIWLRRPWERFPAHLLLISVAALVAGVPEGWGRSWISEFSREKCVLAGVGMYWLVWAAVSRNAKLGLLGALVVTGGLAAILGDHASTPHWAAQGGLAFLLMHSLRWEGGAQLETRLVRGMAAVAWVAHALLWMRLGGAAWMPAAIGGAVLAACLVSRWLSGRWASWVIPASALAVIGSGPASLGASGLGSAPVGLLAVIGSFLLFGLGTLAAVTKHRWGHDRRTPEVGSQGIP